MHIKSSKDFKKENKPFSEDGKQKKWHRNVPRSVGEKDEPRMRKMSQTNGIKKNNVIHEINQNSIPLKRNRRHLKVLDSKPTVPCCYNVNNQVIICIKYFLEIFLKILKY